MLETTNINHVDCRLTMGGKISANL